MGFYDNHILPHLIEHACGMRVVARQRAKIIPQAEGRVVEIGFGTGHNLPFYDADKVSAVIGVDPAGVLLARAAKRVEAVDFPVEMAALEGEYLPFENGSADTVVVTFSLCTIPDPMRALHEMRRILRPNGRLLFAEHGAAPDLKVRRWQERLDRWFWPKIAGGCHLSREPDKMIMTAGFSIQSLDHMYMPQTPRTLGYNSWGSAVIR